MYFDTKYGDGLLYFDLYFIFTVESYVEAVRINSQKCKKKTMKLIVIG